MDRDIRQFLTQATERQDPGALRSAHSLMESAAAARTGGRTGGRTPRVAPELYVVCAEAALQLGLVEMSSGCLKRFFEGNPPANQFLCRAYLCRGRLEAPPTTGSTARTVDTSPHGELGDFEEAVLCFLKAIEMSKCDPSCHFAAFNASVLYLQTVRPLLRPGRRRRLVPSLGKVVRSLEELADRDLGWRAELMMHLIECFVDSGETEEAASFAKVTEEFINAHIPDLYPRLFALLVQHKLTQGDVLLEKSRQGATLEVIYRMQGLKDKLEEINGVEPTEEELQQVLRLLAGRTAASAEPGSSGPLQSPTAVPPADRVPFLLELSLLAVRAERHGVAGDCLKELRSAGGATSAGQRALMECVDVEINVRRRRGKMKDYSKASVEARLKEVGQLDRCLQSAVREGDHQGAQAVCAQQWSCCLPLLQHNLRNRIRTPLLRVAGALEDIQSALLETRCQVHSELAALEEEAGRLEAALTHLQKAALLDDGTRRRRLSSALRLLRLRGALDPAAPPPRAEDQADSLVQQARDMPPREGADSRPVLVAAGLRLAPDDFQAVLDADDASRVPVGSPGSGPGARLAAKAQHHAASVRRLDGHLARQGEDPDHTERAQLWAALGKTARRREVWDVCRAACRFCLLYDDERWKIQEADGGRSSGEGRAAEGGGQTGERDLLRLLAEIRFISGEATVQKLLTEGVQLNGPVSPAGPGEVCEEDPHWVVYRDWLQALSADATSDFLRAAELGVAMEEPWLVGNAAVYLWNYSGHLLAAGEHRRLLPTFQRLVAMLRTTEFTGSRTLLLLLLCDAAARGLIQPLSGPDGAERNPPQETRDKSRNRQERAPERTAGVAEVSLEPAALQDLHKALELCDHALRLSTRSSPGEAVPIAARKQAVATWVRVKRLLQQDIGSKMETRDEGEGREVWAMTRVLVAVETLRSNRSPRHKESSVPGLPELVSMASACSWSDAVVELQTWCQLASVCHHATDPLSVLRCTGSALQLEAAAAESLGATATLYGPTAVSEMLSGAGCLRALTLVRESGGEPRAYGAATELLLAAVRNAEQAESPALCVAAAGRYWSTSLPLTRTAEGRRQLQEPLEEILSALVHTNRKHKQNQEKASMTLTAPPPGSSEHEASEEEDLSLRAAMYGLLLQVHLERADWTAARQLLDRAVRDTPRSRHRLALLKQRILVKAQLGKHVLADMQKFQDEEEQCSSSMWHQVALCPGNITQQLTCYQKSITCLLGEETRWEKVGLLLEFGEWLYGHDFPKAAARRQVQWAVDLLLLEGSERAEGSEVASQKRSPSSECPVGARGSSWTESLSGLKEVRRLDGLVRAHALLAVMADGPSPERRLNLLRASVFVLRIWQVSMAVGWEVSNEMAKNQPAPPPTSAGSKKGKDKGKGKKGMDQPTPVEERPKPAVLDKELPSSPQDWARYACPQQARLIFRSNSNPHCLNTLSIPKQTQSLFYLDLLERELCSLSLDHLTLPIMHLAETIAHDLLGRSGLADLYRLRIVRRCRQLGLETRSPYQEKLLSLSRIQEQEQMRCHRAMAASHQGRGLHHGARQRGEGGGVVGFGQQKREVSAQHIWLDKAEVCLDLGLHQAARQLLAEAHWVAEELRDPAAAASSRLGLAALACEEQNFAQALVLLDEARALGGDEEFWYQLTLTHVRAVVGQRDQDAHTKAERIIRRGCEALRLVLERRVNRAPEVTFFITSLEMRGAVETIRALGGGEPGKGFSNEAVQRLRAACDTLRECAGGFIKLGFTDQAAEARAEYAHGLRALAGRSARPEDKRRLLLDGVSQLQLAVTEQEHVALTAQTLLPSQREGPGVSLAAGRRLLRLRLALAELSLAVLEEHAAEEKRRAEARRGKSSAEIALGEFTRCPPEPGSMEQEWECVGRASGQVVLGQLAAVGSQHLDQVEARAGCLSLMGRLLRLLAVQEDPEYLCALWDPLTQEDGSDRRAVSAEDKSSEKGESREPRATAAPSAELQQCRRRRAQQLLSQAARSLSEAVGLMLLHRLPSSSSPLAAASLAMLECHGRSDPAASGQYLALFQSCCSVAAMAAALSAAGATRPSARLDPHGAPLLSREERPGGTPTGAQASPHGRSQAFSHLSIQPSHLNILAELPPNMRILLLQHSEDGSQLYGAFYEVTRAPRHKGKTAQGTGGLACTRVAKVPVRPLALLALRDRTRAFGLEARLSLAEGRPEASEERRGLPADAAAEETLGRHFRDVVRDMDDYLNPLLSQFDFSCFRPQASSPPVSEMTKAKDKEEKGSSAKLPAEPGEGVVLLADGRLLQLPLEALTLLQGGGLGSFTRDFSLQMLHSRLNREEPDKAEGDNRKETKGGEATKGKADQSHAIKVVPVTRVLPPHTLPVHARHMTYIVDPHIEGSFGGRSLSARLEEILEAHGQHGARLWEGATGSRAMPSRSEMEQLLRRCNGVVYVGMERFMADFPPDRRAAFNLSDCRLALLFDLTQNRDSSLRQSNLEQLERPAPCDLEEPLHTALLLSLSGVGCVVLSQWHSGLQQNGRRAVAVLDGLLRLRQTSGQTVQALRRGPGSMASPRDRVLGDDSTEDDAPKAALAPAAFNCVAYGLPNLVVT